MNLRDELDKPDAVKLAMILHALSLKSDTFSQYLCDVFRAAARELAIDPVLTPAVEEEVAKFLDVRINDVLGERPTLFDTEWLAEEIMKIVGGTR